MNTYSALVKYIESFLMSVRFMSFRLQLTSMMIVMVKHVSMINLGRRQYNAGELAIHNYSLYIVLVVKLGRLISLLQPCYNPVLVSPWPL